MEQQNLPMVAAPQQRGLDFTNPTALEAAQRSCAYLTKSDLVPPQYSAAKVGAEKAAANCLIILDYASRLGVSPLAMMQECGIVNGHPSLSSKFLIATVNSCGRFEAMKYGKGTIDGGVRGRDGKPVLGINGQPLQNLYCFAYTWEKGMKNLSPEERENQKLTSALITMQMAYDEGWYSKGGSKWQTMPSQMLMYRAAAFWCRAYAPELSLGMITNEEVDDISDATWEEITIPEEQPTQENSCRREAERLRAEAMAKAAEQFSNNPKNENANEVEE